MERILLTPAATNMSFTGLVRPSLKMQMTPPMLVKPQSIIVLLLIGVVNAAKSKEKFLHRRN